jgi:hypothetical protein
MIAMVSTTPSVIIDGPALIPPHPHKAAKRETGAEQHHQRQRARHHESRCDVLEQTNGNATGSVETTTSRKIPSAPMKSSRTKRTRAGSACVATSRARIMRICLSTEPGVR